MSFDRQTQQRKIQLFRQSLRFSEVGLGVVFQKVPVRYLKRLYDDDADEDDPVVAALRNLDSIFGDCKGKSVDMASSLEHMIF